MLITFNFFLFFLTGTFTKERLEVMQMISTQVAISFENATLYRNLQSANRQLEAKNKSLMELDQVKDQFLANTSHELRLVMGESGGNRSKRKGVMVIC
jgi:GAF domain-containing protein